MTMIFNKTERAALLETHMVGPKIVERLEQIGLGSFKKLKTANVQDVCSLISHELGTTCWRNSPQAKRAIENAIATAKRHS